MISTRRIGTVALLVAVIGVLPGTVQAQCPVSSTCFFGQDLTGSASTRATNVNSVVARTNFLAALLGAGTENFESQSGTSPLGLVFAGAGTATLNGGGPVLTVGAGTEGNGRYPVSGSKLFEATSASGGGSTFNIVFGSPVAAFGFYGTDIGDFGSQLTLRFSLVGGAFANWTLPYSVASGFNSARDGSLLFAGFISSTQFTGVQFLGTSSDDVFGFDDMTVGSSQQVVNPPNTVPEPSTYALVAVGLVAIGVAHRRRRAS